MRTTLARFVLLAALTSSMLAGTLLTASAAEGDGPAGSRPATQATAPVPTGVVTPMEAPRATTAEAAKRGTEALPTGSWSGTLRPDGTTSEVGTTLVRVGAAPGVAGSGGQRPGTLSVDVAPTTGAPGLRVTVRGDQPGPVQVRFPTAAFGNRYGGAWTSRLRVWDVTGCASLEACTTAKSIPATGSASTGELTATVTLTASTTTAAGTPTDTTALGASAVVALAAGASGTGGDYRTTSLAPAQLWSAGRQAGEMTWSYPMRVPPSAGGLDPTVELSYSSGSVDGRTTSTNNQPSWVGDGFELATGFIERRYTGCGQDQSSGNNNPTATADLCWFTDPRVSNNAPWDNATVVFGAHTGELVRVGNTAQWRLRTDDGSRFEKLTGATNGASGGEYWRMTTPDGTQYYFGLGKADAAATEVTGSTWTVPVFGNHVGEPAYAAGNFAGSSSTQAWRWNLDHVISPNQDTITYYYTPEPNRYRKLAGLTGTTSVTYVRGGYLTRIDYGQREGASTTAAGAQVRFTAAERCFNDSSLADCQNATTTAANAYHWPDVPFDQICATGVTCSASTQNAPTFFSRKRLSAVQTFVRNAAGTGYDTVDRWTLTPSYPDPGDGSTAALALSAIQRTGLAGGSVTLPKTSFIGTVMANRVDGINGSGPLNRWRISAITSATGESLAWTYSAQECTAASLPTPASNTKRCFPSSWTPPGQQAPEVQWFHKYVVTQVTRQDLSGASTQQEVTSYTYQDSPAWHYEDSSSTPVKYRTWSQWRGYSRVRTTLGASTETRSVTDSTYFRGMDGDRASVAGGAKVVNVTDSTGTARPDHWRLAGQVLETIAYNGAAVVSGTITRPWLATTTTADDGKRTAMYAGVASTTARQTLAAGGTRTRTVNTTYESTYGTVTRVEDLGQVAPAKAGDESCTRTGYVRNTTAWIVDTVSQRRTTAGACTTDPATATVLSDERTYYDGSASLTAAPTRGNPTKTTRLVDSTGGQVYRTIESRVVDAHGRVTAVTDAKGRTTATAYTPSTGTPLRQFAVTSPDPDGAGSVTPLVTTTVLDPRRGMATSVTAPNGTVTDTTRDALGRTTAVWLPGRAKASYPTAPSSRYTYTLRASGPNAVTTETLNAYGGYSVSVQIYDGLMRPRQVQSSSASETGRLISDTLYDSRGNAVTIRGPIWDTAAPATTVATFADLNTPLIVGTTIDGAGRVTDEITKIRGVEAWRTTTSYGGDRVSVDPPTGGVPTMTVTDIRGNTTALTQYNGATPSGAGTTTTYGYDLLDRLTRVTDTKGNDWTSAYNLQGEKVSSTDPDQGATTLTYDEVGNLTRTVDARGTDLTYTYDNLNRKTQLAVSGGATLATWGYDQLINGTAAKGLPAWSTRHIGSAQLTTQVTGYDSGNRPTGTSVTVPAVTGQIDAPLAGTYATTFTYQPDGSPDTIKLPAMGPLAAETVKYSYDPAGMPDAVGGLPGFGAYVADAIYSPEGDVLQMSMGNTIGSGRYHTFTYQDGTRRLATAALDRQELSGTDETTTYTYNAAGNPTTIQAAIGTTSTDTQCFSYGAQAQLTEVWTPASNDCATAKSQTGLGGPAPYWQTYTYDTIGNLTQRTDRTKTTSSTTTLTYPTTADRPRPHFATTAATTGSTTRTRTFTADPAGNTLTRVDGATTQTMTWDPEGHLSTVKTGATVKATYLYDADGNRIIRREAGRTTLYVGPTELTVTQATGVLSVQRYYTFNGRTIAVRNGPGLTNVAVLFTDPHNTATHAAAATTSTLTVRRTTPYGSARGPAVTWPGDHGFLDGPTDTTTELTHLGAREYDPALARFLSVDPLLDPYEPLRLNAYSYGKNNPLRYAAKTASGLSDDVIGLATRNVTNSGDTVLGHFPGYITKANSKGASYFDIGDAWNGLTPSQRWAANTHFLDTRIAAGDRVLLSVPKGDIRPGSYLAQEVEYLTRNGYRWTNQWSLVPGG